MAAELGWPRWPGFSAAASAKLLSYDWPGNVRELRNVVERAVYRWEDPERPVDTIQFDPFESPWRLIANDDQPGRGSSGSRRTVPAECAACRGRSRFDPGSCADFRLAIAEYEKAILAAALEKCRWNQRATATALQLSYDQLRHAMKRHELMETYA